MYQYKCIVKDIIDGDTVRVHIDVGFNTWINNVVVRLNNLDTPEIRTKNLEEKNSGLEAKKRLKELLPEGSKQLVRTYLDDKYGRVLGDFFVGDKTVSSILIEEGHGKFYSP